VNGSPHLVTTTLVTFWFYLVLLPPHPYPPPCLADCDHLHHTRYYGVAAPLTRLGYAFQVLCVVRSFAWRLLVCQLLLRLIYCHALPILPYYRHLPQLQPTRLLLPGLPRTLFGLYPHTAGYCYYTFAAFPLPLRLRCYLPVPAITALPAFERLPPRWCTSVERYIYSTHTYPDCRYWF